MIKSLVALFLCSWAWNKWQARDGILAAGHEDDSGIVEKATGLAHDPILTWDFPYMNPFND